MSFNLNLSDIPTHVVVWQERDKDKDNLANLVKTLIERITGLELTVASLLKKDTPLLSGIEVRRGIPPLNIAQETDTRNLFKNLIEKPTVPLPGNIYEISSVMDNSDIKFVDIHPTNNKVEGSVEEVEEVEVEEVEVEEGSVEVEEEESVEVEEEEEEEEVEVEEEEEVEVEVEEEEEEEEVEEEEVEVEEEEQTLELTEFEYKGVTYFRDTENQVYQVGSDGDLDDTAIGVWSEDKQKVLKYSKV